MRREGWRGALSKTTLRQDRPPPSARTAGVSHDSPSTPNVNISGPWRFKHHQNSTRRPPREGRKKENCGGRGEKSAKFLGLPPFGLPTLGLPTSGLQPFGAPPFGAPEFGPPRGPPAPNFFWVSHVPQFIIFLTVSRFGPHPFGAPFFCFRPSTLRGRTFGTPNVIYFGFKKLAYVTHLPLT